MASHASSSSTTTGPSLSDPNVAHFFKLTDSNYLLWLSQMKPFLLGHDLFGYVDGSMLAPATTISTAGEEPTAPNPMFAQWFQIDQLIVSYLTFTLFEPILSLTIGKTPLMLFGSASMTTLLNSLWPMPPTFGFNLLLLQKARVLSLTTFNTLSLSLTLLLLLISNTNLVSSVLKALVLINRCL